jgi:hypothetical protein
LSNSALAVVSVGSALPSSSQDVAVQDLVRAGPVQKPSFTAFESARNILRGLANVADGLFNVPGVKSAAQLALQIIDIVEVSKISIVGVPSMLIPLISNSKIIRKMHGLWQNMLQPM